MPIRDILVLHHSHFDYGYTHSQPVLRELQKQYLDEAFELFEQTADWDDASQPRWTCEVTRQTSIWRERSKANEIETYRSYVQVGRLGAGALEVNGTPLMTAASYLRQLDALGAYRQWSGDPARVAFQHDVNGASWGLADMLLDAGVELFVMAINLHTGGDGPGPRPKLFWWQAPSGRKLLVLNGLHYSMFDQITRVQTCDVTAMQTNFRTFEETVLQPQGYSHDFIYLTTTQVPMQYDNGCPNLRTARLIRAWNASESSIRVRYVTPEQLLAKVRSVASESLDTFSGDWTDFWNYGIASTAFETRLSAIAKSRLRTADLMLAARQSKPSVERIVAEAWGQVMDYDEHTWGAAQSVTQPSHPTSVLEAALKRAMAYEGHELAMFALQAAMMQFADTPTMSGPAQGLLVVNPTASPVRQAIVPDGWSEQACWARNLLHSETFRDPMAAQLWPTLYPHMAKGMVATVELPPFGWRRIPFHELVAVDLKSQLTERIDEQEVLRIALDNSQSKKDTGNLRLEGTRAIASPFYELVYRPSDGRIVRLIDKRLNRDLLAPGEYDFFELVREEPDLRFNRTRKAYYDRDIEKEKNLISCWNEGWARRREGIEALTGLEVVRTTSSISLKRRFTMRGLRAAEHEIRLYADRPYVEVLVAMELLDTVAPESYYLVSTLNLAEGWRASYDSAGVTQEWVREQLPGSSKNWIASETHVAMFDDAYCVAICNSEAPLAMFGGIQFDQPQEDFSRPKDPQFVAWPANNYWETNFAASQPGWLRLRFGVMGCPAAELCHVPRMAEQFTHGLQLLPLASCPVAESGTLFQIDNDHVSVLTMERRNGMLRWLLQNTLPEPAKVTLRSTLMIGQPARLLALTGEVIAELAVSDDAVVVTIAPRSKAMVGVMEAEDCPNAETHSTGVRAQ